MTTLAGASSSRGAAQARPVTRGQVIRSEWIKLRTVRSTWLLLGASALGIAVIGLLVSYVSYAHWPTMSASSRCRKP
jgi:hypothetical protein